jgi:galactose mutarotase-like enzyme
VTYGLFSNVQYTASGHYTLQGDNYTESIEAATGQMTQYLGNHPAFRIRVDGDTYYQMTAGRNTNPLEEMWQRVQ